MVSTKGQKGHRQNMLSDITKGGKQKDTDMWSLA